MPGLSAWAVRRPVIALVAWIAVVLATVGLGAGAGGTLNDSFDLPNTESTSALQLMEQSGQPAAALDGQATVVWSPRTGPAVDPDALAQVLPTLESFASLPSVACVTNPTGASFGRSCPPAPAMPDANTEDLPPEMQQAMAAAARAASPVSADGRVAYATVTFADAGPSRADAKAILDAVTALNTAGMSAGASGSALEAATQEPPSSEAIGLAVAIVILLIAFGSVVAAGMPIVVALVGLATGQMAVLVVARFFDVATFAPTLAAMIGLGVGIDYALFVMNRYRQAVLAGHQPKDAAMEAVATAGRAVLFAGTTVIIALLGLFVLRINFFNGLAMAAAVTVLMVMLSTLWMLPALLSLLGTKALALRLPWGPRLGQPSDQPEGRAWAHYGRALQRRPWLPVAGSVALIAVLAIPMLSLRQGFADDSGKPAGSPARIAYDLRSDGFGPGVNGPFLVAVDLPRAGDLQAYGQIVTALAGTEGVASTQPSVDMLPLIAANPKQFGLDSDVAVIGVIPTTAPQDPATTALLERLRADVNPALEQATGATILVGGTQAITSDFTTVLADALPLFLAVVIGLGFLALVLLFRSLLVPLTAAITSLMSLSAALGITVAVFQWGWLAGPLGVPGTGPIFPFLPIMVFAILFGLSMDYQVFLVSRMQEEWARTGDNPGSVRRGLAGSGRVIVIAAAIMSSVFLAFVPSANPMVKLFGIALASAVIIDAFIVRLVLVPALMTILGRHNWWLPAWLDRILPAVHIEPGADEIADDEPASPDDTPTMPIPRV